MTGVLVVKCKQCGSQKALYISDTNTEEYKQYVDIAELQVEVEKCLGSSDSEIIDTREIDYVVCSCGNYSSVQEFKESLKSQEDMNKDGQVIICQ